MCGFACIITKDPRIDKRDSLRLMVDAMAHRGPDDRGLWRWPDKGCYLGHRRLSIRDLSTAGRQPMANETGSVVIAYNGEIYNSDEMKTALTAQGHIFQSTSDTEVLIHAYEQYGIEKTLEMANGMYAFALIDRQQSKAYVARDPLGIKPCFYSFDNDILMAASEAKAFFALDAATWTPSLSRRRLLSLVAFQYIHKNAETLFDNLNRLTPGEVVTLDLGTWQRTSKTIWQLPVNPKADSVDNPVDRCMHLMARSVKRRLIADVEVGILLSGGIDSSLIAALATRIGGEPVKTFTAGFDHRLDERPYAASVARHIKSDHHVVQIDPIEINTRMEEIIPFFDDFSSVDGGLFTFYLMAEKIRREYGIKVLLVGEGADELFGGYSWFGLAQRPWNIFPRPCRTLMHHYAASRMFTGCDAFKDALQMDQALASREETDVFRQVSLWELTRQLPNNYLMKVDRGTMAHSIEARVPYLDKELVSFVYAQDRAVKQDGTWFSFRKPKEKKLLRETARTMLPPDAVNRKKRGFSIPMVEVLRSHNGKLTDRLLASGSIARSFFKPATLEHMIRFKNRMYSPFEKEKEFLVWKLFLLETWRRHFNFRLSL